MEKKIVKLQLDYLQGPIWISDVETGEPLTGIEIVDRDIVLAELNFECSQLYMQCYEFDVNDKPCVFNDIIFEQIKEKLLVLIGKIKKRLSELNDGSFIVEDYVTKHLLSL